MRYRMEVVEDELVIRNVDMDIRLGTAIPIYFIDPGHPHRSIIRACTVLTKDGEEPLQDLIRPKAAEKRSCGDCEPTRRITAIPGFREGAEGRPDTHRVECLLGKVLADAVSVIARASIEYRNGGLKDETKSKYADLIVRLHDIWYASRFGSFDGERHIDEPYFANTEDLPRISFAEAARQYGMHELRMRFPEESDETLKEMLSWPLDLLRDTLDRLSPQRHPL